MKTLNNNFGEGLRDGIPIGLGYLSVSFGFGIMAVSKGISVLAATMMSLFNITSAGQVAALGIIASNGGLFEIALTQFLINLRYSLMSLSLSQKMDNEFTLGHRLVSAYATTDEIFAVASGKSHDISREYMYGIAVIPIIGWTLGTFLGAAAGSVLPLSVKNALGIAIYGMFIAIVVPPAKKSKGVLFVALTAIMLRLILVYTPVLSQIPSGFALIICTVIASAIGAAAFPTSRESEAVQ